MKSITLLALALPAAAQAHSGHGLPGADHWHATDVWGFVALAVGVAIVVWTQRRK
jgi:thiosulfate reductase cytochrome b subunit